MGQSPPGETYNIDGEGTPFIQGCAEFGDRHPTPVKWCSAATAKRALAGDVLLSVRAPVGRINRAAEELIIGRGIAAIRGKDGTLTDYVEAALLHREPQLQAVAAGSTFTAVTKKHVETLRIPLPPVEQQRRIADLLAAIDSAVATSSDRSRAALVSRERLLAAAIDALQDAESRTLGSLADVQSGVSWTKADELHPGDPAGMGVMGVTNVQRDYVHARDCGWIRRTPQAERRSISGHTILTIRTNGNPDRIGNVHLAPSNAVGYTISSFLTAITAHDPAEAGYMLRVLQSPQVQDAITAATSGSTGLKNIAVTWIRGLEIPWPSVTERRELDTTAAAFDAVAGAHAQEALALTRCRDAFVRTLVSGIHEIPEAYDRFLSQDSALPELSLAAV